MSEPGSVPHGDVPPPFDLPDTNGDLVSLTAAAGVAATAVVFTCNHCPYALAWHDRLLAVAADYADRGVRVLLVNPNDTLLHASDSYEAMQERVAKEGPWPAPYLRDETQQCARSYGARTTPDVFLMDGDFRIVYRGAPDGDYEDPSRNAEWLRAAIDDVLAGRPVAEAETEPVGCSVKWKTFGAA